MHDPWQTLRQVLEAYREILGGALCGFYVHGSLAFGCFSWEKSDLDFLVAVREPPAQAQKEALIRVLLHAQAPEKGFEMSVVLAGDCAAGRCPCPYCLHYSNAHRAAFQADLAGTCARMQGTDPDLTAHFAVVRHVGRALYGPDPQSFFAPVPRADYLDSIRRDVRDILKNPAQNPLYAVLNLCRAAAYARQGQILSKRDGAVWGAAHLPDRFLPLIQGAQESYRAGTAFDPPQDLLTAFCRTVGAQI